jgi:hypothetical protein
MSKQQWGSFPDAFGEDDKTFTGGTLAKSVDHDDIDLEAMCRAMETLNNRAKTMNKAQLYRLNYKLGLAVNKFKEGVQKYLHETREKNMNQETTFEKVHGNPMEDAGLTEPRHTPAPKGDGNTFTKAKSGDMSDTGL